MRENQHECLADITMKTLFPASMTEDDVPAIPGICYRQNYISAAEEQLLVKAIDLMSWDESWKRRRQPYGAGYGSSKAHPPIPAWGKRLADRLFADGTTGRPFDQMLVNEYLSGQGIAMHCDHAPFDRTVVSLSLLSPCVMGFSHIATGRREWLLLEPRSLLVLSDAARYEWLHGIAPRKKDVWHGIAIARERRLSITFRARKS